MLKPYQQFHIRKRNYSTLLNNHKMYIALCSEEQALLISSRKVSKIQVSLHHYFTDFQKRTVPCVLKDMSISNKGTFIYSYQTHKYVIIGNILDSYCGFPQHVHSM